MTKITELDPKQLKDIDWHCLSPGEALDKLDAGEEGLSQDEVESRRDRFGSNKLPEQRQASLLRVFLRQFKDPLIYVLLIAGSISLAIGNLNNALFIFAVLLLNAVIGTIQEWRAESSAESLQNMLRIRSRVLRDNEKREIESTELVPGDIVLIEAGDSVPADLRLLKADNLHVDESLLTGESIPVAKQADDELDDDTALAERSNLLHAGSSILDGKGKGVVCRTGATTEMGHIADELSKGEAQMPPLVIKLRRFTRTIAMVILLAVALLAALQLYQGAAPVQIFFLSVALAVSAIPAGLPVAITVAMSIASSRMAKRHVIVRQLAAVEGLGACTLIASDKTGTLTENVLTIKRLVLPDDNGTALEVEGEGLEPQGEITRDGEALDDELKNKVKDFATIGALCNDGELIIDGDDVEAKGDSVDVAFLLLAAKLGLDRESLLEESPQVGEIPFNADQRFAASFNRRDDNIIAHVKGAAEAVLEMCKDVDAEAVQKLEEQLADRGYRVLAVASGEVKERDNGDYETDDLKKLNLQYLAALIDPIRAEAKDAVKRAHAAGVDVRMITGDHPATGLATARKLGIADEDSEAVTGKQLRELEEDEESLAKKIRQTCVFARVEPTQKTEIVKQLQKAGHFVAVTGDGVNDAPALKRAHIGIAMGKSGTDVARRAAALILTDDNFASIVNGIEEGRTAYDNVRKVTWLLLATGAAEVLLFFLAIFTSLPLPLNVAQLLWLNLVTNGIQDVALAFEKAEPGVLKHPPRPPEQGIFDRQMIKQTLASGLYIGLVAFALFYYLLQVQGLGEVEARNLLLLLMVLFENMHAFSCRSESRSLFRIPLGANPLLVVTIFAAQGIHILAMYIPGLNSALQIMPVSPATWSLLLAISATLLIFDELSKWRHRSET